MPRYYVNSLANFMIQGGMVSFTLQDQATRTQGGRIEQAPPETVADVVMREQDFAQLLAFLNQHAQGFEQQSGRRLGQTGAARPEPGAPAAPAAATAPAAGGFKIRPSGE